MNVVLRAAAAYWILLFAVRFIGRRTDRHLHDRPHASLGSWTKGRSIRIEQVRYAIAERDGKISIIEKIDSDRD